MRRAGNKAHHHRDCGECVGVACGCVGRGHNATEGLDRRRRREVALAFAQTVSFLEPLAGESQQKQPTAGLRALAPLLGLGRLGATPCLPVLCMCTCHRVGHKPPPSPWCGDGPIATLHPHLFLFPPPHTQANMHLALLSDDATSCITSFLTVHELLPLAACSSSLLSVRPPSHPSLQPSSNHCSCPVALVHGVLSTTHQPHRLGRAP